MPKNSVAPTEAPSAVPGSFGVPVLSAMLDKKRFFSLKLHPSGVRNYTLEKMEKHGSVWKGNMGPNVGVFGPCKVVAMCDQASMRLVHDPEKVERSNVFFGLHKPPSHLTQGVNPLAHMDYANESHAKWKGWIMALRRQYARDVIASFEAVWQAGTQPGDGKGVRDRLDDRAQSGGKVGASDEILDLLFSDYMSLLFHGVRLSDGGPSMKGTKIWQLGEALPAAFGIRCLCCGCLGNGFDALVEMTLASPKWADAFGLGVKEFGLTNEKEAAAQLAFVVHFNAWPGHTKMAESALGRIAKDPALGAEIAAEWAAAMGGDTAAHGETARWEAVTEGAAAEAAGGGITRGGLAACHLLRSAIHETFRMDPLVTDIYGKTRQDVVVAAGTGASYHVPKGTHIVGLLQHVQRDPLVFPDPDQFDARRFMPEADGSPSPALAHLMWSNGPSNQQPTPGNKQCAAPDLVIIGVMMAVGSIVARYEVTEVKGAKGVLLKRRGDV